MELSEQSFQRFLDLIYEAAEKPERWRYLYAELQLALGVKSIHILALDQRHGTLSYSDGANMPVQGELAYMQHYRFIDPRVPVILQRPLGESTHCHEILSDDEVALYPFYQEFLIPYDRRYISGCKLWTRLTQRWCSQRFTALPSDRCPRRGQILPAPLAAAPAARLPHRYPKLRLFQPGARAPSCWRQAAPSAFPHDPLQ